MSEPVTRQEQLLSAIAAGGDIISPVTREEMYLAYMAGDTSIVLPEPVTRKEQFLHQACLNGGSGGVEINNQDKTITENGEYTADAGYTGLGTVTVNVPTSGGGAATSAKWNDVTFIDYDGSVLYSYSLAEAQALTELPTLPAHDGLVCQGWNWTIEAIKALNRPVTVGAMYITDDGATRLHIKIATVGRMTVPLYIGQTVANGVSIDWGDGSTAEKLDGTGNVNTSHTYAAPGDYVISLMPEDGCTLSFGAGSSSYCVMGSTGSNGRVYFNMLQEVYIGENVTSIGSFAFDRCYSLASVTIPNGVTSIGNYAFQECPLASITIPDSITTISSYVFQSCYSLASITIPDSITTISSYVFQSCYSLASITIPDSITTISSYVFQSCYSLASITIPDSITVIEDNAFFYCHSLASITIPDGVIRIYGYAFYNCHSLASITIPDGVPRIYEYAFYNCYGMAEYHLKATTPPSLININAFGSIPSDCIIYVPQGCLEAYQNATNWSTYADYMQEEPT